MSLNHAHVFGIARYLLEQMRLRPDIPVIQIGGRADLGLAPRRLYGEQPIGVRVRQRPQEHALNHREDGRVSSYAQR